MSQKIGFKLLFLLLMSINAKQLLAENTVKCLVVFSELQKKLNLPILVVNVLAKKGINTLEQLTSKTPRQLLNVPHFSVDFLDYVRIALAKKKLSLRNETALLQLRLHTRTMEYLIQNKVYTVEELLTKTEQELLNFTNFEKRHLEQVKTALSKKSLSLKTVSNTKELKADLPLIEKNSISSLDISNRAKSVLQSKGITEIKDLIVKTEAELLSFPSFGEISLNQVKIVLSERNLFLKKK